MSNKRLTREDLFVGGLYRVGYKEMFLEHGDIARIVSHAEKGVIPLAVCSAVLLPDREIMKWIKEPRVNDGYTIAWVYATDKTERFSIRKDNRSVCTCDTVHDLQRRYYSYVGLWPEVTGLGMEENKKARSWLKRGKFRIRRLQQAGDIVVFNEGLHGIAAYLSGDEEFRAKRRGDFEALLYYAAKPSLEEYNSKMQQMGYSLRTQEQLDELDWCGAQGRGEWLVLKEI